MEGLKKVQSGIVNDRWVELVEYRDRLFVGPAYNGRYAEAEPGTELEEAYQKARETRGWRYKKEGGKIVSINSL